MVVDIGPLVAALDADDADHKRCLDLLERHSGPLLVPASVGTAKRVGLQNRGLGGDLRVCVRDETVQPTVPSLCCR